MFQYMAAAKGSSRRVRGAAVGLEIRRHLRGHGGGDKQGARYRYARMSKRSDEPEAALFGWPGRLGGQLVR